MKKFFPWPGAASPRQGSDGANRHREGGRIGGQYSGTWTERMTRIVQLCKGPSAPTILRPLGEPLAVLAELLCAASSARGPAVAQRVNGPLAEAARFLEPSSSVVRQLEFVLGIHSDQDSLRRFFIAIEEAFEATRAVLQGSRKLPALEAGLADWRSCREAFSSQCEEVWELHAYAVFLDIKGDRALMQQTARSLCQLLGCSPRMLLSCFDRTWPWAESALRALARRELEPMLIRLHTDALRSWRRSWQKRVQEAHPQDRCWCEDPEHGSHFWDGCFTHLFKVTWRDFMDGFEHFYIHGRCPIDLSAQLRLRMDPSCKHQVARSGWLSLMSEQTSIWDTMDTLLDEVLADVGARIYRETPLSPNSPELQTSEAGAAAPAYAPASGQMPCKLALSDMSSSLSGMSSMSDPDIPTPADYKTWHGQHSDNRMAWDDYTTQLQEQHRSCWAPDGDVLKRPGGKTMDGGAAAAAAKAAAASAEGLRVEALRSVKSGIACTRSALIFRVVRGDLANDRPVLVMPPRCGDATPPADAKSPNKENLPSLVVTAHGCGANNTMKFGRGSARSKILPDFIMNDSIASRSHFSVVFDQEKGRYSLMDAASKQGTYVRIANRGITLSCGDWIQVGGVEFIVRYCGGGCACRKRHAHYRLHSLRLLREHRLSGPRAAFDAVALKRQNSGDGNLEEDQELLQTHQMQDELFLMLNSRRPRGWLPTSARLCQQGAPVPAHGASAGDATPEPAVPKDPAVRKPADRPPAPVPIAPLELEFISGPRLGEKLVLCERVCTLGRGDGNTIQVNDGQLASISRVHCVLEHQGGRWQLRDNGSTNGTWRRLSCVLEPSELTELSDGMFIKAGEHEFLVEEADMPVDWVPSMTASVLGDMLE